MTINKGNLAWLCFVWALVLMIVGTVLLLLA